MKTVTILGSENILGYGVLETLLKTNSNNYKLRLLKDLSKNHKIINSVANRIDDSDIINFTPWSGSSLSSICTIDSESNPDYVINCLDEYSEDTLKMSYINSYFPQLLSSWTTRCNVKLIHFSSIKSLDLEKGFEYTETHKIYSNQDYGQSKKLGEPQSGAMVLRLNTPIGVCPKNEEGLVTYLKSLSETEELKISPRHILNSITNLEAGRICKTIIDKNLYEESLVHVYSPMVVSLFQLSRLLSDKYKLNLNIKPDNKGEIKKEILSSKNDLNEKLQIPPLPEQIKNL